MRAWELSDDQRERLGVLERVQQPTDWQRGEAAALRMSSSGEDRERAETLLRRWGPSGTPDRGAS